MDWRGNPLGLAPWTPGIALSLGGWWGTEALQAWCLLLSLPKPPCLPIWVLAFLSSPNGSGPGSACELKSVSKKNVSLHAAVSACIMRSWGTGQDLSGPQRKRQWAHLSTTWMRRLQSEASFFLLRVSMNFWAWGSSALPGGKRPVQSHSSCHPRSSLCLQGQ